MATPITTKEFFDWIAKTWTECQESEWSEEISEKPQGE